MEQTIRRFTDEEHCDGIVCAVGYTSKGKESAVNEFLTPEELQKHQDEQTQPLLTEAIQTIQKAMLDTHEDGGKRLLRVDLRFEKVMPRVVTILKKKKWDATWNTVESKVVRDGSSSHKTYINLTLIPRIVSFDPRDR